jgi:hypothetical protein
VIRIDDGKLGFDSRRGRLSSTATIITDIKKCLLVPLFMDWALPTFISSKHFSFGLLTPVLPAGSNFLSQDYGSSHYGYHML